MKRKEVLQIYSEAHAQGYDEVYRLNPDLGLLEKSQFEIETMKKLTARAKNWLDVACGTGYLLRHARGNSDIECMGLDLNPGMLSKARRVNPDLDFVQADFLEPQPSLVERWEVTLCIGMAYSLLEKNADIEKLVKNLAKWTKTGGVCFMPIYNLPLFAERQKPGEFLAGFKIDIDLDRNRWSLVDPNGTTYRDMLAPSVSTLVTMIERHFGVIEVFPFPGGPDDKIPMIGVVATKSARKRGLNQTT